jgi:Cu-processing system permease protein
MPFVRIYAIAAQTFTEARRNKVFYSLFLFALIVIVNSYVFTEVTIATLDRMIKDTGIAAINLFALSLVIFTGIGVINREIDRRSLYVVVVKPIARYEFILGKYVGLIAMMVATCGLMFVGLLIALTSFRTQITPSLFLGLLGVFLEVAVLGALAVLCSTFTNSFASAFITAAVFISGHLSAELKFFAAKSSSALTRTVGELIFYLVPNLERFNFKMHVAYDLNVGGGTLAMTCLYAAGYVAAFLTAAVVAFSRRDFR